MCFIRNATSLWVISKKIKKIFSIFQVVGMIYILIISNLSNPALYFMWNFLPAALSSVVSTVSQVASGGGGYGRPHLSRYGNKYSSGALASYDEYDDYNYSAAGEHFVSL